ncbi:MAG TPA: heparinase II/III family protein [Candidatus Kapabacteria bacterium]|nr:heparinase II/III family protein [Candidatus Kapabacteria bacterium]
MNKIQIILKTFSIPILVNKVTRKVKLLFLYQFKRIKYQILPTYINSNVYKHNDSFIGIINDIYNELDINTNINQASESIQNLSLHYKEHYFKLLGSDWVKISLDGNYRGFNDAYFDIKLQCSKESYNRNYINKQNRSYSLKILQLLPNDYELIDWQRDFRSGFRWDSKLLSIDNIYGNTKGVDVKHTWELGRMQHLIVLYHQWKLREDNSFAIEFQNQILDFIATNPPEFGIQWKIAMDPSIRAVNWAICFSLFVSNNYAFDEQFKNIMINSIYTHYYFIKNNLEWGSGIRGNHYFSNITALLILILFLNDDTLNADFEYFLNQFKNEIHYQFLNDGGNFEISLPYHFFVVEMLSVTLLLLINSEYQNQLVKQFTNEIKNKLQKIYSFTTNNLNIYRTQSFGDCDSGYFFRFNPPYTLNNNEIQFNLNNYSELLSIITHVRSKLDISLSNENYFPNFGVYNFIREKYKVNFFSSEFSKLTRGAHQHNDVLSYTMQVSGEDFIIDSGTYNYTALPEIRNQFRSIISHNVLQLTNWEQHNILYNNPDLLFWLLEAGSSFIESYDMDMIKGKHNFFEVDYQRKLEFGDNYIYFNEVCDSDKMKTIRNILSQHVLIVEKNDNSILTMLNNSKIKFTFENCDLEIIEVNVSPYYGEIIKTKMMIAKTNAKNINWKIEVLNEIN